MPAPPSQADLEALATRALAQLEGDGQATAWWERSAAVSGSELAFEDRVRVEVAQPGGGIVTTDDVTDDGLHAAAAAAQRLAAPGPPSALPEPAIGRAHDGYDPAAALSPESAARAVTAPWRTAAAKIAIASTRGVRAYEQRSFAGLALATADGRLAPVRAAATGPAGLDAAALAAGFLAPAGERDRAETASAGERPVVLGPWAVATLLEAAAWQFGGASASRFTEAVGTRLVAPCINLSDSPRFPGTLPRSYDAEDSPVQPVPLIQDGVAHRAVHDATTAVADRRATTGHAVRPAGHARPRPRNLVLVGGGAADVAELAAGIDDGLLVPALDPRADGRLETYGMRRISHGRVGAAVEDAAVSAELFGVLAATDALTARQWLVPADLTQAPRDTSCAVVPALRARAGVQVL